MTKENQLKADKIERLDTIFPPNDDSCVILVGCGVDDYVASRLARAVEDVDARLLNLNVTSLHAEGYGVVAELRVSHRNSDSAVRSLERYGFDVLQTSGTVDDDERLRARYDELMHYLSI